MFTDKTFSDWDNDDIIAAIKINKLSLSSIAKRNGVSTENLTNTLTFPWPEGELVIARAIGVSPAEIWPSRYFEKDGSLVVRKYTENGSMTALNDGIR